MVELEDLVARRDYVLKPLLRKTCECGSTLNLLQTQSTVKQMCNDSYCRKIYPIMRKCTFCDTVYDYEEVECKVCDMELTKLTNAEGKYYTEIHMCIIFDILISKQYIW